MTFERFRGDSNRSPKTEGQTGIMESFLSRFIGKRIDVYCGGSASLRGDVVKVESGVLHLRDAEGKSCYIAIDKIVVVWDARDDTHRAGFMPPPNKD